MAILGLPNAISLGAIGISMFIFFISASMIYGTYTMRKTDRYLYMRKKALEENLPFIKVIDLAGNAITCLGEIEGQESIYFKDKRLSLRVRPSWLDVAEPIVEDGIRTYYYYGKWYFPGGATGLTCLLDVVDAVNKQFPELNFLKDDIAIITSLCTWKGEQLRYNCEQLLIDYEQEEYLIKDGYPIQEVEYVTEYQENELLNEYGDPISDEDGEPIYYFIKEVIEVPKVDEHNNPVYVKNPDYLDVDSLLSVVKRARQTILNMELRPGFINIKRAMPLIPGKSDGKNVDTLIKIEIEKEKARKADDDKTMKWIAIIAIAMAILIIGCYAIYTLFPVAQNIAG